MVKVELVEPVSSGKTKPDSRGTREKILDCAARLYSEHGYNEGSVRNIAAAIGIRGPSLYHYFASKEAATAEILTIAARRAEKELAAVLAQDPPLTGEALFDAAIAAHLRAIHHPKRYLAALIRIYGEMPAELQETATRELATYLKQWTEVLRDASGNASVDLSVREAQAMFIFGAIDSTMKWHYGRRARNFSRDELKGILRSMILNGLRPRSG